jgi:hypothetical protein
MTSPADLFAAKQAAERIVEAFDSYTWMRSDHTVWRHFAKIASTDAPLVARAFLAMPEVQAAHWVPVAAGRRS